MKKLILFSNILILFLVCIYYVNLSFEETGRLVYSLDDTYIHLSIAKNFAIDNNWGINSSEFSSTTSSPLFTLTESGLIKIFGINDYYPIFLNILFGILYVIFIYYYLKNEKTLVFGFLITLFIWLPLIFIQIYTGMEHMLHILLIVMLIKQFILFFENNRNGNLYYLMILSFLATGVRYESLFLILAMILILFLKNKYLKGLILGVIALLPVIIYGFISVYYGADFLPNSLLLKGNINSSSFMITFIRNLYHNPYIIIIISILFFTLFINKNKFDINYKRIINNNYIQLIALITIFLHSLLAKYGWLYRYDAYLLVISLMSLIPFFNFIFKFEYNNKIIYSFALILFAFLILFTVKRIKESIYIMNKTSKNIYEQHFQMADFIKKYYNNSSVVANDIGVISYYSDAQIIDIVGLGNNEVQRLRRKNKIFEYNTLENDMIQKFIKSKNADIAIIYDVWFTNKPDYFYKTAEWKISDNRVCGSEIVSFYGIGKQNEEKLRNNLIEYKKYLNKNVTVTIE